MSNLDDLTVEVKKLTDSVNKAVALLTSLATGADAALPALTAALVAAQADLDSAVAKVVTPPPPSSPPPPPGPVPGPGTPFVTTPLSSTSAKGAVAAYLKIK